MKLKKHLGVAALAVFVVGLSVICGCSGQTTKTGAKGSSQWESVIDFQYDSIGLSPDASCAVVRIGKKYGAYYKNGDGYQLICKPEYDKIVWSMNGGAIFAKKDGKTEVFNHQYQRLFKEKFSDIYDVTENDGFIASVDGNLYGFLSRSNEWLLPTEYLRIIPLSAERFIVFRQDNSRDLVNSQNVSVLPKALDLEYQDDLSAAIRNQYLIVKNKQTYFQGVINLNGELVLPTEHYYIQLITDEKNNVYFITQDSSKRLSVYNDSGKLLFPATFCEEIRPISKELFAIRKQNWWGLINKDGYEILSNHYPKLAISPISGIGYFKQEDNNYGLINKQGERISQENYQDISISSSGLIRVQKENKTGYLKKDGTAYIPCLYDYGDSDFSDDLLLVAKNQKLGFIDREGHTAVDFIYDFASPFSDGYAVVIKGKKLGVINTKGELVVPLKFEASANPIAIEHNNDMTNRTIMLNWSRNNYPVKKGDKWGCIKIK